MDISPIRISKFYPQDKEYHMSYKPNNIYLLSRRKLYKKSPNGKSIENHLATGIGLLYAENTKHPKYTLLISVIPHIHL